MAVTNFIWDELSDNVMMETDENDAVIATYTNEPSQFGEVVSKHQHGQDYYFHFDGLGSTRNLTDQNQAVTDSYTYTAFGETVATSGSTPNSFKFNGAHGYYTNSETNDIYVRRRTYNPSLARWLSWDPLGFIDGPNKYVYVKNLVPNANDPDGLLTITPHNVNCPGCGRANMDWHLTTPVVDNNQTEYFIVQYICLGMAIVECYEGSDECCYPLSTKTCDICWFELLKDHEQVEGEFINDKWKFPFLPNSPGKCGSIGAASFLSNIFTFRLADRFDVEPAGWQPPGEVSCNGQLPFTVEVGEHLPPGSPFPTWLHKNTGRASSKMDHSWECCNKFSPTANELTYRTSSPEFSETIECG